MTTPDVLLTDLERCQPSEITDRATEALSTAGKAVMALAERPGYHSATLWWAAGALGDAYAAILPHTNAAPTPETIAATLADDPATLVDLLRATARALLRASRATADPDLIHALASAAILTEQARDACSNAKTPVS